MGSTITLTEEPRMTNIIFIPGLGADERLFEFIKAENCNAHFIRWMKPGPDESLLSYVGKIKSQVSSIAHPVLVGVSLGGIVAMELREMMPVQKTILISSIKTRKEKPVYFDWINKIHLDEAVPAAFLKKSAPWIRPLLNGSGNEDAFRIFKDMLFDADASFISWGIRMVLEWERTTYEKENLVHIHGTGDLVFPIRNIVNCDYKIKDGAHDMILTRADEINEILAKEISMLSKPAG